MAWAFRAAASAANSSYSDSDIVINKPTGTAENDLLFAAIAWDGNNTITPPSGWTLIRETTYLSNNNVNTYYKVAGASEPSTYTWSFSGAEDASGGIVAYSGIDGTPLDVEDGQANSSSTSATAPSITTNNDNELLVGVFTHNHDNNNDTWTPPSGMTERVDQNNTWTSIEITDENFATAGATGTRVATVTTAQANVGHLAAFKEAAAGGATGKSNPLSGPFGGPLSGPIG